MGIRRGSISTPIIVDGLVFNIDAANRASYPRTGTTTFNTIDLSQSGSINGAIFDSTIGAWQFDGTDDNISIPASSNLSFGDGITDSPFSFNAWIKIGSSTDGMYILCKNRNVSPLSRDEYAFYISTSSDKLIFFLYDADILNRRGRLTDAITIFNQWIHVAVTYDGRGGSSAQNGIKLYINGIRSDNADSTKNTYTAMHTFSSQPATIGSLNETAFAKGNISNIQIYNRELSATEVAQNYNALKGRFGL